MKYPSCLYALDRRLGTSSNTVAYGFGRPVSNAHRMPTLSGSRRSIDTSEPAVVRALVLHLQCMTVWHKVLECDDTFNVDFLPLAFQLQQDRLCSSNSQISERAFGK